MPEWPDLHVLRSRIEKAVGGRRVTAVRVHDPLVLRATRPLDEALAGRTLTGVADSTQEQLSVPFDQQVTGSYALRITVK